MNKKGNLGKRIVKVVLGVFSTLLVLVLLIGLVLVGFYKSGEASLKASASSETPVITVSEEDEEAIEKVRQEYELTYGKVVEWQDDWVAYENTIYTYNEDTLNFLLMGIDKSGTLKTLEDNKYSKVGQADAIFLVSLNQKDKSVSIIGIPRNSMVEIEVYNDQQQKVKTLYDEICLQYPYAGGGEMGLVKMKDSVSEIFYQLPIHGACAISFDAIGTIVDMLGGITVTVPDDMTAFNPSYKIGTTITLTKNNAIEYLRYRNRDTVGSPTVRLTRQKEFMKAAINVAFEKIKENPMIVSDIYQAIVPYMNTDITLDKAVYLAKESIGYSITSDSFYQLTGENEQNFINDEDYYDEYYLDEDALKELFMKVFYTQVVITDES